jgi:KUP system potassium uptake protein
VLPISAVVIIAAVRRAVSRHRQCRARLFGPVMAVWFVVIGVLGAGEIAAHPYVLLAISPTYAVMLCVQYKYLPSWCSAPWCCA